MKRVALPAVLWLGYALRLHGLADKAVWFDEGWNAWMARFSWSEIVVRVSTDTAPPLHFWLLHLIRLTLGESAFALRYLSLLAGVLALAVTAQLGRSVGRTPRERRAVALAALLLMALSRFHISWSQEIRMYTLSALCAALAFWGALRVWQRGRSADHLLYAAAAVLGLYTHYLGVFVLAAVNLAWLWEAGRDRRAAWRWIATQFAVAALFAPWLLYALGRMRSWSAESPVALPAYLEIMWTTLAVGIPLAVAQFRPFTVPLALLFAAGCALLLRHGRRDRCTARNLTLLGGGLLLPAVLIFLLALPGRDFLYTPPVAPRYFMLFVCGYSALLSWALAALGGLGAAQSGRLRRLAAAGGLGWALTAALVGLAPYYPGRIEQDVFQSVAATLAAYRAPEDAVVLFTDVDWPTFDFYAGPGWRGAPSSWRLDAAQTDAFLEPIWAQHAVVWLVTTPEALTSDPQGLLPAWLAARGAVTLDLTLGDKRVTRFARSAELPAPRLTGARPPSQPAAAGLLGAEPTRPVYESGDLIHLFLYRDGPAEPPLTAELVDAAGRVWQAQPATPDDATRAPARLHAALVVPPEAPDGRYRLRVQPGDQVVGTVRLRQKVRAQLTAADVRIGAPLEVRFADNLRLLGYDLGEIDPAGRAIPLTLYWQADGPLAQRYKVFTHLLGEVYNADQGNFLWGQQDNEPVDNTRPTTLWRVGEVIVDRYRIPIAPNAPPGLYQIEIGLYNPVTGERLPTLAADGRPAADHIELTTLRLDNGR